MNPFGLVASGLRTDRKNAAGRKIAEEGMPERTVFFKRSGRLASST
jgi:hypothetical protein